MGSSLHSPHQPPTRDISSSPRPEPFSYVQRFRPMSACQLVSQQLVSLSSQPLASGLVASCYGYAWPCGVGGEGDWGTHHLTSYPDVISTK